MQIHGCLVKEFNSVKDAAIWLYNDRYQEIKRYVNLFNVIKNSDRTGKPTKGVVWKYIK